MVAAGTSLAATARAIDGLFDSERRYFAAGSINKRILNGTFSIVPGYSSLPSACLMHAVDGRRLPTDIGQWAQSLEEVFGKHGSRLCRLYVASEASPLQADLTASGYQSVKEVGLYTRLKSHQHIHWPDARLRPIDQAHDWQRKAELYVEAQKGPDGHNMQGRAYAELERIKCEAGYMRSYLYWHEGQPVAAVSLAISARYARMKNVLVHPEHRGQGIGLRLVHALFAEAVRNGATELGAFAAEGGVGHKLYHRCGLRDITYQIEWTKPIC